MRMGLAAVAVGKPSEYERTQWPHREGDQDRERDCLHSRVEIVGNRLDHENQQEEVERVERPAEEAREECRALLAGERPEIGQGRHVVLLRCTK